MSDGRVGDAGEVGSATGGSAHPLPPPGSDEPLTLGARTFGGRRGSPPPVHVWPEDGYHLWDEDPQTQFYVCHNRGVTRCGSDLDAVETRTQAEIPMGYNALLGCQKVAVVRPDGTTTRWAPVPHVPVAEARERSAGVSAAWGYVLHPRERVENWVHPAYPARYPADDDGFSSALRDATALAARAGYPVVIGLVLRWTNWH